MYPTETIELPSKGLIYPIGNPLKRGEVELKYMTAVHEDILTNNSLLKKGTAIDKLLRDLIVTKINYDDLILGDKNAIMIAARILGYGNIYEPEMMCPNCRKKNKLSIDLSTFDDKLFPEDLFTTGTNEFKFILPGSKREITFKLLTHADEAKIDNELKFLTKMNEKSLKQDKNSKEVTTRLKYTILSVDGDYEDKTIRQFVDKELMAIDSRALREYIYELSPDIDTNVMFECEHCDYEDVIHVPMTAEFFWPNARI